MWFVVHICCHFSFVDETGVSTFDGGTHTAVCPLVLFCFRVWCSLSDLAYNGLKSRFSGFFGANGGDKLW